MKKQQLPLAAAFLVTLSWLSACASSNPASGNQGSATAPAVSMPAASMPGKSPPKAGKPVWTVPTEEEIAAALDNDKEMINAAKGFTKLKKDGELMFCKRYKPIGSTIPQIQCITTAQLRVQFEDNNHYKNDMRLRTGKCDITAGCQAGG